mmetsp:Transcript_33254/g.78535  ORF Transcript_33254/g.78535 Transcript_33254/m.78535 type:complete len:212 (+) Transcript_33254:869-1504(+)
MRDRGLGRRRCRASHLLSGIGTGAGKVCDPVLYEVSEPAGLFGWERGHHLRRRRGGRTPGGQHCLPKEIPAGHAGVRRRVFRELSQRRIAAEDSDWGRQLGRNVHVHTAAPLLPLPDRSGRLLRTRRVVCPQHLPALRRIGHEPRRHFRLAAAPRGLSGRQPSRPGAAGRIRLPGARIPDHGRVRDPEDLAADGCPVLAGLLGNLCRGLCL